MLLQCFFYATTVVQAQSGVRGHVILPRTEGATVLSTYINASANRVVANGDFLESAAIARQIHLESDRIAMENSIQWVETYFERKKLNQEYRDDLRKDYQERKASIGRAFHQRIASNDIVADPTAELNYMVHGLIGNDNAFAALVIPDKPVMKSQDLVLTPNDVSVIVMDAGSGSQFKLGNPVLVDSIWPKGFLRPEFEAARQEYDTVRKQAKREINQGNLSLETFEELNRSLAKLSDQFEYFYTWDRVKNRKTMDLTAFVYFKDVGNRFIRTQRAGALRAFSLKDPNAYEARFQFHGDKVTDLLRYCSIHHVKFANPNREGMDVYAKLYRALREIYLEFITDIDTF